MEKGARALRQRFAEAFLALFRGELESVGGEVEKASAEAADDYARGYLTALRGMVKALGGDDRFYTAKIPRTRKGYEGARRGMQETAGAHLLSEFDAGYMAAWVDYLDAVLAANLLDVEQGVEKPPDEEPGEEEASKPDQP